MQRKLTEIRDDFEASKSPPRKVVTPNYSGETFRGGLVIRRDRFRCSEIALL